ncbi:acylneuraminate cytidylyltransferase [Mycoplasmatota bacterium]|nr:acylneuraminate cytidylyltransferase [Mycoplasmatota bacterium]
MMKIGIIPLRKGSKGIPGKNRKMLLGRPLFAWTLIEANKSLLDKIYVYSDDDLIIEYVKKEYSDQKKIVVMNRSPESASDTASTEFAMWELASKLNFNFDSITLIQATSPLLTSFDINKTIKALAEGYDSSLTVAPIKRFFWDKSGNSLNYNYLKRPRRQDFEYSYVENGACYTITKEKFIEKRNRIFGKVKIIEMEENSMIEIDEPHDFDIVEKLLEAKLRKRIKSYNSIKLLCLDVDGVLTDGTAQYIDDGEYSKNFSMFDGKGLEIIRKSGVKVCVITSENSSVVKARIKKLNIDLAYYGIKDKYRVLDDVLQKQNIKWSQTAYIGDDINDYTNIIASGISFCPENAADKIKAISSIVLSKKGGNGAVREACEIILKLNRNDNF